MITKFIVAHRREDSEDPPLGFYKIEEVESEVESVVQAVREALSEEQILHHEYEVYEVQRAVHSDELKHAGVFDDLGE